MATDWIKVTHSTPSKPEVLKLSRLLGVTQDDAFGKLIRFWVWVDANSVDGSVDGVTSTDVDAIVSAPGLMNALSIVGWVEFDDEAEKITIPNFSIHNGESAKKRALKSKRQTKWRQNKDANVDAGTSTNTSTRIDKIRKEYIRGKFAPPTHDELVEYFTGKVLNPQLEASKFLNFYISKDWHVGKTKMSSWRHSAANWVHNAPKPEEKSVCLAI